MATSKVRPTFVISLDEELVWGSFDHTSPERFALENPDLRGCVRRLISLFDSYQVPTTWAVVGHLFLDSCERDERGRAHPDLVRPDYTWYPRDWFESDPCGTRTRYPLWYGDDLIEMILGSTTRHEIGSHSFAHQIYGDPGCTTEVARTDLAACVSAATRLGLTLRSFVFPRNVEGHHALLAENGFAAYRGEDAAWFRPLHGLKRRAAHFLDQAAALPPPLAFPEEKLPGLWNIPGSMPLLGRSGIRRAVPLTMRIRKAKLGLRAAVERKGVFHLWFHPFNMSRDPEGMFWVLEEILKEASRLRDKGRLDILTMGSLAAHLAQRSASCEHAE